MPVRVEVTSITCKVCPEDDQFTECGMMVKAANHITTFLMLTSCKKCKAAAFAKAEGKQEVQ